MMTVELVLQQWPRQSFHHIPSFRWQVPSLPHQRPLLLSLLVHSCSCIGLSTRGPDNTLQAAAPVPVRALPLQQHPATSWLIFAREHRPLHMYSRALAAARLVANFTATRTIEGM